jgi:hypothetical protein
MQVGCALPFRLSVDASGVGSTGCFRPTPSRAGRGVVHESFRPWNRTGARQPRRFLCRRADEDLRPGRRDDAVRTSPVRARSRSACESAADDAGTGAAVRGPGGLPPRAAGRPRGPAGHGGGRRDRPPPGGTGGRRRMSARRSSSSGRGWWGAPRCRCCGTCAGADGGPRARGAGGRGRVGAGGGPAGLPLAPGGQPGLVVAGGDASGPSPKKIRSGGFSASTTVSTASRVATGSPGVPARALRCSAAFSR